MSKMNPNKNKPDDDEPLSLDMSFDEALELLVNTPLPDSEDEDEVHQQEHKQDDDK